MDRRDFMKASALAGAALSVGATPGCSPTPESDVGADLREVGVADPPAALRILILGGTGFLGPHLVRYAVSRGHSVTTFTRGRTEPRLFGDLFGQVESLVGDRADNLTALEGREWDAVIDNSGQRVEWTRASAELLKDQVQTYMYTSSTGVYLPYMGDDITEDTEVDLADDPPREQPSYGVMKALSELAARRAFGDDRTIVVRPTYIVGPGDTTDRFPYWPARLERGGEVLVPGKADDPVQWIDVRDLTEWMIRLIENGESGTYNGVGPASTMGMHAFVHGAHAALSVPVEWVYADDYDFLREHRIGAVIPWIMPVDDYYGSARINRERSVASGLTYRPLARTVTDIREWWHSDAVPEERRQNMISGPSSLIAREAEVIRAWRAR
jgi:2'-hydroxyisoflavone reductase